jgi:DNA-binding MarR family transcriptional regulator
MSSSAKIKTRQSKQHTKFKKKSSTRLQHGPVQYTPRIRELTADSSVIREPSHKLTQLQKRSATSYTTTTYLILPHFLLDEVLPTLNAYEQVLLMRLYRLSYGSRRQITDHVGKKTLAGKCNMSIAMVKKVLKSLKGKGLIETIPDRSNDPTKGNKYRVLTRLLDNPGRSELGCKKTQHSDDP